MTMKRKILLTIFVFLLALTVLRLVWIIGLAPPKHPQPINGLLDLRNWDFSTNRPIDLNGEWEFYPNQLIHKLPLSDLSFNKEREFIQVPNKSLLYDYGTYRLRILVDPAEENSFGIRISSIRHASEVYVNGKLLTQTGQPADRKADYVPLNKPSTVYFTNEQAGEIELVIQFANYEPSFSSGIVKPLKFGSADAMNEHVRFVEGIVIIACSVYLLHGLYSFVLFIVGRQDSRYLYFSLITVCIVLGTLIGERLLFAWIPFNFSWSVKVTNLAIIVGGYSLLKCMDRQLSLSVRAKIVVPYTIACGISVVSIVLLSTSTNLTLLPLYILIMLIPCLSAPFILYRRFPKIEQHPILLLLCIAAAVYSLVWLIGLEVMEIEIISYPFDLMAAMICFAAYWFQQYFHILAKSQQTTIELHKANEQKDEFLATVAHEIRNPLHSIINISETLVTRKNRTFEKRDIQDLKLLVNVGRHMSMLLNDLLDLTRLKENRLVLRMGKVSAHSVAEAVIDMLRYMTDGKSIRLINRIRSDFPPIYADENRLFQILFNLLHNAVKYSRANEVSVHAFIQDGLANICVTDTGVGISEQYIDQIFEPYERASYETGHMSGGIGLGLSISKQLAELHEGKLQVTSEANQGTTFTLCLKLYESTKHAEMIAISHEHPSDVQSEVAATVDIGKEHDTSLTESVHILIVDDNPLNLKVLKNVLSAAPYEIHTATSGTEALAMLEAKDWYLIIADVMMPHMSGFELTQAIRKRFAISELPVLLLTARDRPEDIEFGFLSGANDYLKKPVNGLELHARVKALIALKRSFYEQLHMDVAYLQAQIQPHFLFNTLNSIAALSEIDTNRMHALLEAFGNYLKASFDFRNLDRLVPLDHEIELVRSYLYIEKERFAERLEVIWEIDQHLRIELPPLTIQPLVENALQHGVLARLEGGTIQIRTIEHRDHVEICVSDNGVGMNEEAIKTLLQHRSIQGRGVGLYNTDRRLKQIYGKGLHIESEPGKGTKISFTVPL